MPEIFDMNPATKSKYDGEAEKKKKYAKLGAKITDNVPHKLFGLKTTDEEYWGLREMLSEDEVDIALSMKPLSGGCCLMSLRPLTTISR